MQCLMVCVWLTKEAVRAPRRVPGPEDEGDEPGKLRWKVVALARQPMDPHGVEKARVGRLYPSRSSTVARPTWRGSAKGSMRRMKHFWDLVACSKGRIRCTPLQRFRRSPTTLVNARFTQARALPLDRADAVAHQALEYSDNVFVAKGVVDVVPAVPADASLGCVAHASLGCVAHASLGSGDRHSPWWGLPTTT